MNIAIDIDSVLSDSHTSFIQYYNRVKHKTIQAKDLYTFNIPEVLGLTPQETQQLVADWMSTDDFKNIALIEGAVDGVTYLHQKNRLIAVTARPPDVESVTKEWLDKHFPDMFQDVIFTNTDSYIRKAGSLKKSDVCKEYQVTLIIEDQVEFANDCVENGIDTFLLEMPWNTGSNVNANVMRVQNWQDLIQKFKETYE